MNVAITTSFYVIIFAISITTRMEPVACTRTKQHPIILEVKTSIDICSILIRSVLITSALLFTEGLDTEGAILGESQAEFVIEEGAFTL